LRALAFILAVAAVGCHDAAPERQAPTTIRVAVIGGMIETGFWRELAGRYELVSGNHVEVVANGPKPVVIDAFRKGGIDLIVVHTCDAMIQLVADGLAVDPQPWLENDMVFVGPSDDPAHVRGEHDAAVALAKIVAAKAPLLVHASNGADGVLHDLTEAAHVTLDPGATVLFSGDNQHAVVARAAELHAYTLIGRIPYVDGKLRAPGIELMVQGDRRLRRPYLVETATNAPAAARDLAAYLRSPATQQWIGTFGVGRYDDQPLFYPIVVRNPGEQPAH
jgi:tungstate transport system substrate-binding protein